MDFTSLTNKLIVFTMSAKTMKVRDGREQVYRFMSGLGGIKEIIPLTDGKIVKYNDLIWYGR